MLQNRIDKPPLNYKYFLGISNQGTKTVDTLQVGCLSLCLLQGKTARGNLIMLKPDFTFLPETREPIIKGNFCYILLSDGSVSVCDAGDIELLSKGKFSKDTHGYVRNQQGRLHRLLNPTWIQTDHKNEDKLNNCRYNLRECNNSENAANRSKFGGKSGETSSKYKGVSWNKNNNKWAVSIIARRVKHNLGQHDNEINAAKAYDKKAIELFGEFARPNFIDNMGHQEAGVLYSCVS